ncbi:MAG: DUF4870 domain-containing protein [Euryarchaeota archaeon]|nr:DUF4870 domain-containing protein [Euryarchaeota archaeon]
MADTKTPKETAPPKPNPDERTMACVAYILTWITGLIVLLTAQKTERFKRWHAIQAIALGIAVTVLVVAVQLVFAPLAGASAAMGVIASMMGLALSVGTIVLVVLCAVKAYQGGFLRLPFLADVADRNA